MQNDTVNGIKAVKALWGVAHINNHKDTTTDYVLNR
jgi:hypothetical protein